MSVERETTTKMILGISLEEKTEMTIKGITKTPSDKKTKMTDEEWT